MGDSAEENGRDGRYHHGRLRAAMVEATVTLVEELGAGRVSVREAARRAGVSSGAPFRHFPSRAALLTAAAEEAMRRFRHEIDLAMTDAAGEDALVRLSALARAYLTWAMRNPTLFEILADRRALDLAHAEPLRRDIAEVQRIVTSLLSEAKAAGLLRSDDLFSLMINLRTLAYGMARMFIERQLAEIGVADANAETTLLTALRHHLRTIAADPDGHAWRV